MEADQRPAREHIWRMPEHSNMPSLFIKLYGDRGGTYETLYAGGEFYEPARKRFVSLEDLRAWKAEGAEFVVWDMESGKDVSRDLMA
jgi:polyhydroxyalkanoate synthesis regulator protein